MKIPWKIAQIVLSKYLKSTGKVLGKYSTLIIKWTKYKLKWEYSFKENLKSPNTSLEKKLKSSYSGEHFFLEKITLVKSKFSL